MRVIFLGQFGMYVLERQVEQEKTISLLQLERSIIVIINVQ